jgi:hypothetical protein
MKEKITSLLTKVKKAARRIRALFPSPLPKGMVEFDTWAAEIIDIYGVPNNDSFRFSLAVQVMHLDATTAYKSKEFFGRSLYKAMSNQICANIIQELKEKQKAAEAAAKTAASDVKA